MFHAESNAVAVRTGGGKGATLLPPIFLCPGMEMGGQAGLVSVEK